MKKTSRCRNAMHREEGMLQDSKSSELHRWPRLPKSLPLLCTDLLLEPLKAVCLGGRFYSSVLWTVPQNSAKMEKKKAMGCGEGLCQLIGFSCPLVGSMEEEVAGPWACRHCGGCLGCSKHWQQLQQPWLQLSQGEKWQVRDTQRTLTMKQELLAIKSY